MTALTAQNDLFDAAPARRVLYGDKKRKTEPAQHIIEFPGGAVEVSRLEDGSYWAHIIVHQGGILPGKGLTAARGQVVDSRVDWAERRLEDIPGLPDGARLTQIAVRILPDFVQEHMARAAGGAIDDSNLISEDAEQACRRAGGC